ncbi:MULTISPECIES: YafY family protein [Brevibacillus]|uniref:helix-turn-helix transcriptional regulator n=1 Tax=Brevibacillus TaxID=55080 RepID=UPI000D10FE29|nr:MULTISPECIES: YafY family protein [Brevibacillus]MED1945445.1 YafY family protein [Brevibacillus formosus]MED1998432.1 YafY family protein [Brevibacillus formosus]MED2081001.1 YafY family protein [Brevibacillus formosus]PSK16238.1 YafY family transcriptional regulator [Brevibacillus sp. NRRL NRS-603]
MNKTDRLLAIVLELQRKGTIRAEDLAATFETSVRTIYRDMQALSEAGVPIVGAPGQGYSLMEGYFLPPVSFSVEEAVALLIGADLVEQVFDQNFGNSARAVQRKVEAILSADVGEQASRIRSTFRLVSPRANNLREQEKAHAQLIHDAIINQRKVRFRYRRGTLGEGDDRETVRDVAPYGLVLVRGSWILLAHCDLRQDIRRFRLSRMSGLVVLEDRFILPDHFNFNEYKPLDDRSLEVQIVISTAIADRVKESGYFFIEEITEHPDGFLVRLRVRQIEEILSWVLGLGADAVVLTPESLRIRVRDEAKKLFERY